MKPALFTFMVLLVVGLPAAADEAWPEPVLSQDPARIARCQAVAVALHSKRGELGQLYRDTADAGTREGKPVNQINAELREIDQLRMDADIMAFDLHLYYGDPAVPAQDQSVLNARPIVELLADAEACFTWPGGRKPPRPMAQGAPLLNE